MPREVYVRRGLDVWRTLKGGEVLLRRIWESLKMWEFFGWVPNIKNYRGGMSIIHCMFFLVRVENAKVILFLGGDIMRELKRLYSI